MAEYIERDAIIKLLKHIGAPAYAVNAVSLVEPIHFFADVVPVVHGRWTEKDRIMYDNMREEDVHWFTYVCSVCNGEVMNNTNYCPNCGARMDGE